MNITKNFKINWKIKPTVQRHSTRYEQLIAKAMQREYPEDQYGETHHIIPKSFGGSNDTDNLVRLTAREHYIAHLLLWKMRFPGNYGSKMSFAFCTFINKFKTEDHASYKISSRIYESFKKEYSMLMSEKMSGEGNHFYGKTHSLETRKIIGEKSKMKVFKTGPDNPSWGKKLNLSEEERNRRSAVAKSLWENTEKREQILTSRKKFMESPLGIQYRKEIGDRTRGIKRDPAIIEKTASKKRGKKAHEIFSPQALVNIAEGRKNRKYSPEAKAKMAEHARQLGSKPKSEEWKQKMSMRMKGIKREQFKCEHCGIETVLGNIRRWHGDNCKQKISQITRR